MTKEGYGEAYREGLDRTIRYLMYRGVPRDAAADIAQLAWMRGWERLRQLRDDSMLLPWINVIAMNCHRRAMRHERSLFELESSAAGRSRSINPTATNLAAIEISRALQRCDANSRGLLEAQMSGTTVKELAAELGVTETAVRIRLHRARRAARMMLESVPA